MDSTRATLEQLRARHAWSVISDVRGSKCDKDFAREVRRLPVRIRTAGLGQALRFIYAKSDGKDHRSQLLTVLGEWVLSKRRIARRPHATTSNSALLRAIIDNDADTLRRATEEVLLYLQWLSRFCEAEIKVELTDDDG